jgi:hypothetical protein
VEGRKSPRSLFVAVSLASGPLAAEPREAGLGAQSPGLGTVFAPAPRPMRRSERMPVKRSSSASQPFGNGAFDNGAFDNGAFDNGPFDNGPFDNGPFDNSPFGNGTKSPQYSRDLREA